MSMDCVDDCLYLQSDLCVAQSRDDRAEVEDNPGGSSGLRHFDGMGKKRKYSPVSRSNIITPSRLPP
jgi:hypothetical protein